LYIKTADENEFCLLLFQWNAIRLGRTLLAQGLR